MSRFLGDNDVECGMCDGIGIIQATDETCWLCGGIGVLDLVFYDTPLLHSPSKAKKYRYEIWSPLLCDEETIARMKDNHDGA